jgi:hypothetical protein
MSEIRVSSVQNFDILNLKNQTKRRFIRTEERPDKLLFVFLNSKGRSGETFYVSEEVTQTILDEALNDNKNYTVTVKFK